MKRRDHYDSESIICTEEPWYNEPLYNEVLGKRLIFFAPLTAKLIMKKNLDISSTKPRYSEQISSVLCHFVFEVLPSKITEKCAFLVLSSRTFAKSKIVFGSKLCAPTCNKSYCYQNEVASKKIDRVNERTRTTSCPKQLQVNLPCHALQTSRREASVLKLR